jgi:DNA-binding winged helix-turn-helix (wHTH) protein
MPAIGSRILGISLYRSRAFDLLLALVERHERVVAKGELMELVWPGRVVEEGNLTVHIAELRKLLGRGLIATLPGRGYRFVAPVEEALLAETAAASSPAVELAPTAVASVDTPASSGELPAMSPAWVPADKVPRALTRLIGRADDLDRLGILLVSARLITVVGPVVSVRRGWRWRWRTGPAGASRTGCGWSISGR